MLGTVLVLFPLLGICDTKLVYKDTKNKDCNSDNVPIDLGVSCQKLLETGECNKRWMLDGEFCIATCDFCGKQKESVFGAGRSFANFSPFSFSESIFINLRSRTLRGCTCPTWKYEDKIYTGCGNPNNSPIGGWCPVTQEDCPFDPIFSSEIPIKVVYEFYDGSSQEVALGGARPYSIDSCTCLPDGMCKRTRGGCSCTSPCSNPDYDLNGPWCYVDKNSCPSNFIPEKSTEDTDYCRPGCCPV